MFSKRNLGIGLLILGIIFVLTSFYLKNRTIESKRQITEAQGNAKQGSQILSQNPITKDASSQLIENVQAKIDEVAKKAGHFETVSLWMKIGGGALVIISLVLIIFSKKKKIIS